MLSTLDVFLKSAFTDMHGRCIVAWVLLTVVGIPVTGFTAFPQPRRRQASTAAAATRDAAGPSATRRSLIALAGSGLVVVQPRVARGDMTNGTAFDAVTLIHPWPKGREV